MQQFTGSQCDFYFSFEGGKKQIDSVLKTFEYFRRKSKEREDDLHKSYNDRSYLSSEDAGPGESRTGVFEHLLANGNALWHT